MGRERGFSVMTHNRMLDHPLKARLRGLAGEQGLCSRVTMIGGDPQRARSVRLAPRILISLAILSSDFVHTVYCT